MNGVDYQKALMKERKNLWNTIKDQKKAYEDKIDGLNEQHTTNVKNQKDNYLNHKNEMERVFKDRYDKMDSANMEALSEKNKQYQEETEKLKNDFSQLAKSNIQNFNKKFSNLRNKFDENLSEEKENNKLIKQQLSQNYDERVQSIRKGADKEIQNYLNNAKGSGENLKNSFDQEKKELITKFEKDTNTLMKSELEKRNLLKQKAIGDIQNMVELNDKERMEAKDRQKENFQRVIGDANQRVSMMEKKMNEERERTAEVQSNEIKRQNQEFANRFSDQEKRFNKNVRDLERKNRINGMGAGSIQDELANNRRQIEKAQIEEKSKLLIEERDKILVDTSKKLEEADDKFRNDLKELKMEQAEKSNQKAWENSLALEDTKTKDRLERANLAETFNESLRVQKNISDKRLINEKKIYNQKVDNLKDNYRKELADAVLKSDMQFSEYKKVAANQKQQLQRDINRQNTIEKDQIKESYSQKIDDVHLKYERKIASLETENSVLNRKMEDAIRDSARNAQDEINRQRDEFKKVSEAEISSQKEIANQKVKELKSDMTKLQASYDKKMNDQRLLNQRKLKQTSFNYEQILKNERKRYQDIIDQNSRYFQVELSRMKTAGEEEKARLVSQYEDQISKMNEIFQKRQEDMERFVVLSKT